MVNNNGWTTIEARCAVASLNIYFIWLLGNSEASEERMYEREEQVIHFMKYNNVNVVISLFILNGERASYAI